MADSSLPHGPADRNLTIVLLASSCVLIGGITQMLLGFFKMGNLIKYIPHPVSAGFLNGIAILLIWKQLPLLLGLDRNATLLEVLSNVSLVNLSSLVIGAAALGAVFVSKIFLKLVPSILFGLLTDAVVYSILLLLTDKSRHVAVIGELAFTLPTIGIVTELFHQLPRNFHYEIFYDLCGYGMVLGMLGSMESLMSSSALENLSEIKVDSIKELLGQGLGNIAASPLGSISDDRKVYQLKELEVFNNFSDGEVDTFKEFLDLKTFTKGNAIISEGQNDRDLLMMTRGLVSITLHLPNSDRTKRLFTVTSGAIIGEMALLDGQPRSTDVWADEDSEFYRLTFDGFKKICSDHPQIALKFVSNIALVINQRLRVRSQEIRMLVDK
jgi:hypothetical protein